MMYLLGQGVKPNYSIATKCLKRAADHDDEEAQYWLGLMYLSGRGVDRDEALGIEWLTRSLKNGFEDAKKLLESEENRNEMLSSILRNSNQEETKIV